MRRFRIGLLGATGLVAAMLAGCSPTVVTRGDMIEDRHLASIRVGQTTQGDVIQSLGTPSTVSTFDPRVWYYIGQRTQQMAFFQPEIVERRVVMMRFNDDGRLEELRELGLEDGQDIELVSRETPTLGRRMTFLEQMVGNIGRFRGGGQSRAVIGGAQPTPTPGR